MRGLIALSVLCLLGAMSTAQDFCGMDRMYSDQDFCGMVPFDLGSYVSDANTQKQIEKYYAPVSLMFVSMTTEEEEQEPNFGQVGPTPYPSHKPNLMPYPSPSPPTPVQVPGKAVQAPAECGTQALQQQYWQGVPVLRWFGGRWVSGDGTGPVRRGVERRQSRRGNRGGLFGLRGGC